MADFNHLRSAKYIDLVTFRKTGAGVHTPVWFGYDDGKLYVMTRPDSGKMKRIRNNPLVRIAASTIRGKVIGPEVGGVARLARDPQKARRSVRDKYWLARVPFLWSKDNIYLEIEPS